jgi:hypothetical protein
MAAKSPKDDPVAPMRGGGGMGGMDFRRAVRPAACVGNATSVSESEAR